MATEPETLTVCVCEACGRETPDGFLCWRHPRGETYRSKELEVVPLSEFQAERKLREDEERLADRMRGALQMVRGDIARRLVGDQALEAVGQNIPFDEDLGEALRTADGWLEHHRERRSSGEDG